MQISAVKKLVKSKIVRISDYLLESVGKPETHIFFVWPKLHIYFQLFIMFVAACK